MASDKKHKKKYRVRKGRVAAAIAVAVVVVSAIAVVCVFFANKGNNGNKGSTPTLEYTVNPAEIVQDGEYVRIDMEDCNLYVGNILRLKCISNPEEYADRVIWSTSDGDVVSVNGKGDIIVKSEGTAAISATYGVFSDSVIIHAVSREDKNYDNELPVYDVSDGEIVVIQTVATGDTVNPNPESGLDTEEETDRDAVIPDEPATQPGDGNSGNGGNGGEEQQTKPSGGPSGDNTEPAGETEPDSEDSIKDKFVGDVLNAGFSKYLDDTYIYVEAGNYLGEIIVGDSFSQIYVMTRTSSFDASLKQVIMSLLPTEYENVFARLISAQTDSTFGADGYKVRIVAPTGGGHAQLIIYY